VTSQPEPRLIDTGGADDNVPLDHLANDPDPRFRPSAALTKAVAGDGHGSLDRPIVPLLNALQQRGIETLESCAGGMLFARGGDRRTVAALELARRSWMQMRWAVGEEQDGDSRTAFRRLELWWSRSMPNWGGYLGVDADWRWRQRVRSRRSVHQALLVAARRVETSRLPHGDEPAAETLWLEALLDTVLTDRSIFGSETWFEVVLSRDSTGYNLIARREFIPLGSVSARTLNALRNRVDADPEQLINGTGVEGLTALRAAMAEVTGKVRWAKLTDDQRRSLLAVYATPPSQHAR
jgi:hypothetical protein